MKNPEINDMIIAISKSGLPFESRKNVYCTLFSEITTDRMFDLKCYFDIDVACDEVLLEYLSDLFEIESVGC